MAKRNLESLQRQYSKSSHGGPGGPGGGHGPRGGGPKGRGMGGKPKNAGQTIARLLKYLKPHTWAMILVLICMLTHTVTALVGSYLLSPVINHIAGVPMAEDASVFTRLADSAITALTNFAPIRALIDLLSLSGPFPYLFAALCIFVLIYGCGIVASYTQARLMVHITQSSLEKLRNDL
ncbi:MAG: ABC transporter ATP-binding protein, partial [Ruminococcaceae bacterium]|nr:ABC transporter ATP-binding protein [Oscillospiraceae bacterium]